MMNIKSENDWCWIAGVILKHFVVWAWKLGAVVCSNHPAAAWPQLAPGHPISKMSSCWRNSAKTQWQQKYQEYLQYPSPNCNSTFLEQTLLQTSVSLWLASAKQKLLVTWRAFGYLRLATFLLFEVGLKLIWDFSCLWMWQERHKRKPKKVWNSMGSRRRTTVMPVKTVLCFWAKTFGHGDCLSVSNLQEQQIPLEQSQTIGPLVPFISFLHQPFTALTSDLDAWILHRTDLWLLSWHPWIWSKWAIYAYIYICYINIINWQGVGCLRLSPQSQQLHHDLHSQTSSFTNRHRASLHAVSHLRQREPNHFQQGLRLPKRPKRLLHDLDLADLAHLFHFWSTAAWRWLPWLI